MNDINENTNTPISEMAFITALQTLKDNGAVLYMGNYQMFLTFRDNFIKRGLPIAVVYKPEFNDIEWKMVSENGAVYSTGIQ